MQSQSWQNKVDRYLRSGDPKALGLLYERAFPLLLRQARGLGLNTAEAEDLVHETFVVAMERREDFRQGGNFEAWLNGILRNKALKLKTRKKRRYDPRRLRQPPPEPPEKQLQEQERLESFERTLQSLPSKDRRILELFLMDASKPQQIARELGIKPGTLRVQLHRALARLRCALLRSETKKTSGLLGLFAFLRFPSKRKTSKPSLSFFKGAALLGLPLALVLWFFPNRPPTPSEGPPNRGEPLGMGEAFFEPPTTPRKPSRQKLAPLSTSSQRTPTPALSAPLRSHELALHLVFASSREPAPGIGLRLLRDPSQDPLLQQEQAVSDPSGTILFRGLKTPWVRIQIDRGKGRILPIAQDRRRTEVTLEVQEGSRLQGRCLDETGQPLSGVGIWLSADDHHALQGQIVTRSGKDGIFVLRGLQRGHLLAGILRGHNPSRLLLFTTQRRCTLVLPRGGGAVLGHVVDQQGHPISGAEVLLGQDQRTHLGGAGTQDLPASPTRLVRTDKQGAFYLQGLPTGPQPLLVRAPQKAPWARQLLIPRGGIASPLVRLMPGRQLHILCLDPQGKPLGNLPILVHGTHPFQSAGGQTDPRGRLHLESLPTGPLRIQAIPETYIPLAKALPPGTKLQTLVLRFKPLHLLHGLLLNQQGNPLRQWKITNRSYFTGPGIQKTWLRTSDLHGRFQIPFAPSKTLVLSLSNPKTKGVLRVGLRVQGLDKEYQIRIPDPLRALSHYENYEKNGWKPQEETHRCLLLLRLPKDHGLRKSVQAKLTVKTLGGGRALETKIQVLPGPPSRVPLRLLGKGPFQLILRLDSGQTFLGDLRLPPTENFLLGIPVSLRRPLR